MGTNEPTDGQPVVVVTGGGGGIGAAVATELGRVGWHVVTVDPLVAVDGTKSLDEPEVSTAELITAAGGSAEASSISVTDAEGIRALFAELVERRGRLDAVVNAAGISRPTSFTAGAEEDWAAVLSVHVDGYRNVLAGALPIMAAAGRGRILGVTSGSGWRQADAGAYSCAKRTVAALTWQLGADPPEGVVINAMSPIAMTRMVTTALARAGANRSEASSKGTAASGGLALGAMPTPEQLGPTAVHLVSEEFTWCSGQVFFVGGTEVAVVEPPHLLDVVRLDPRGSTDRLLETVTSEAFSLAEARQLSTGAANPRFATLFSESEIDEPTKPVVSTAAVICDHEPLRRALTRDLEDRGVAVTEIDPTGITSFADASSAVDAALSEGTFGAVVLALAGEASLEEGDGWEVVLAEHHGIVPTLLRDVAWTRAVVEHHGPAEGALRLVTLTAATSSSGRSRAQATAQLARSAAGATAEKIQAFAVSLETDDLASICALSSFLAVGSRAGSLAGSELMVGSGFCGLRSHPRPRGSIVFGGPDVPSWLDLVLGELVDEHPSPRPRNALS